VVVVVVVAAMEVPTDSFPLLSWQTSEVEAIITNSEKEARIRTVLLVPTGAVPAAR
jgi:hypothetical protein